MKVSRLDPVIQAYRKANPRSRAVSRFKLARNTSATRQSACIFCGACGPTWCARWAQTKTAEKWEAAHACAEYDEMLQQVQA